VAVILKAREPARIMTAIGDKAANRWHLQMAERWVVQYNFYVNDRDWGRMFMRICPHFPFSARICLTALCCRCKVDHREEGGNGLGTCGRAQCEQL
jgi:hypothetical protein